MFSLALLIFAAGGVIPPLARAQGEELGDSLGIEELVQLARSQSPAVRAAELDRRAASFDSLAAARNRRPAFSVFGGITYVPDHFYDPVVTNQGEYQVKTGIEWPLLDGRARAIARKRAANQAELAVVELSRARRESGARAAELAIESLRLKERERAQLQSFERLQRLESLVRSAVRAGSRGEADALRVSLERDRGRSDLEETRSNLERALRELNQVVGRPIERPMVVREPEIEADRFPVDDDSLAMAEALERLPEVREARLEEIERRLDVAEARQRDALHLDASADAGLAGADLTTAVPEELRSRNPAATFSDRLRDDLGASASLEFRKPFANTTTAPTIRAREAQSAAAILRFESEAGAQRRLSQDVLTRWRAAWRRVVIANADAEEADKNLLRFRNLFAGGAVSLLELLDSQSLYNDVLERLAQARADLRQARIEAELRR